MSALSEKLKKGREEKAEIGPFIFTFRRPTDAEYMAMRGRQGDLVRFVTGWAKKDGTPITEMDLGIPADLAEPFELEFEPEAFYEFVTDTVTVYMPLVQAIVGSYNAHLDKLRDAAKN